MYLQDLISWINNMKPDNRFSDEEKIVWVNEIEGRVQEAFLQPPEILYEWETDKDTELILSTPHDSIYRHYLRAQLSYANEEYDIYQNEMEMFNSCWKDFLLWVCNHVKPAYRKTPWIPKVYPLVRGESTVLSFICLPVEREDIQDCTVSVWQKGEAVLEYGMDELIDDGEAVSVEIPQADSLDLTPGAAKVTMVLLDEAGNRYEHYPYSRLTVVDTKYRLEMS